MQEASVKRTPQTNSAKPAVQHTYKKRLEWLHSKEKVDSAKAMRIRSRMAVHRQIGKGFFNYWRQGFRQRPGKYYDPLRNSIMWAIERLSNLSDSDDLIGFFEVTHPILIHLVRKNMEMFRPNDTLPTPKALGVAIRRQLIELHASQAIIYAPGDKNNYSIIAIPSILRKSNKSRRMLASLSTKNDVAKSVLLQFDPMTKSHIDFKAKKEARRQQYNESLERWRVHSTFQPILDRAESELRVATNNNKNADKTLQVWNRLPQETRDALAHTKAAQLATAQAAKTSLLPHSIINPKGLNSYDQLTLVKEQLLEIKKGKSKALSLVSEPYRKGIPILDQIAASLTDSDLGTPIWFGMKIRQKDDNSWRVIQKPKPKRVHKPREKKIPKSVVAFETNQAYIESVNKLTSFNINAPKKLKRTISPETYRIVEAMHKPQEPKHVMPDANYFESHEFKSIYDYCFNENKD